MSSMDDSKHNPDIKLGDRFFFMALLLLVTLGLFYVLREVLSPMLLGIAVLGLVIFLRRGVPFEVGVGWILVLLMGFWFFAEIIHLLWPFVFAFVLAYVLAPLVGILTRFVPRGMAIVLVVLLVVGLVSGIGAIIIPKVITEVSELVYHLPGYGNVLFNMYTHVIQWIENLGLALPIEEIRQWIVERLPELGQIFADQTTLVLKSLSSGVAALLNLFMIPFVAFYLLKDFEKIIAIFKQLLPPRHAPVIWDFMNQINNVLGQYVRGQMLVSSFIAILTTIGLALSGIRYAVLLGIMAGVFNLVPFVGLAVSLGVSSFVALLDANGIDAVVKVVVVFVVVQGIEGNFLSPKVVGERVGLHPVWVMVALVVSAHFWGIIGMVVAIPVAAVVNIVLKVLTDRYVKSHYYGQLPDG